MSNLCIMGQLYSLEFDAWCWHFQADFETKASQNIYITDLYLKLKGWINKGQHTKYLVSTSYPSFYKFAYLISIKFYKTHCLVNGQSLNLPSVLLFFSPNWRACDLYISTVIQILLNININLHICFRFECISSFKIKNHPAWKLGSIKIKYEKM